MDATQPQVTVSLAPPESAEDESLVNRLVVIINAAYTVGESDLFHEGYERTNAAELSQFIKDGDIAIASLQTPEASSDCSNIIGCVRVQSLSPSRGEFAMLALDTTLQGRGTGRDLVRFAEQESRRRGKTMMQVELLFPTWFESAGKQRLQDWYTRLGYVLVRKDSFQESYPHLAPQLRGECEYRIYEKPLA